MKQNIQALPTEITVFQRGWLSANNILFTGTDETAVVDTGYHTDAPETVALVERAADRVGDLSLGDRKRLEFGMALANDPDLLLLDEPTAGMSIKERHYLMEMVATRMEETKKTLLFVEHDIDVVMKIAQRVTVMARGAVLAAGTPGEIAANEEVQSIYLGGGH